MIVNIEYASATNEKKTEILEKVRSGMSLDELLRTYDFFEVWDCLIVLCNRERDIWEALTFVDDWYIHEMEDCIEKLTTNENEI